MQPTTPEPDSLSERCLLWAEKILKERKNPDGAIAQFSRRFRKGLTGATAAYFLFLFVLLAALGWWGERNWLLSILLFIPAALWLMPLLLLTPLHLIFRPALCGFTLAAILLTAFIYLDFNWSFSGQKKSHSSLVVVTGNIGQRKSRTLREFVGKEKPDIIALQEAWHMGRALKQEHPKSFVVTVDEFVLASKFPIRKSGLLTQFSHLGRSIGAWYELDFHGKTIVLYNIHMPTPRPEFIKLRGRGFLAEAIGGKGIYSAKAREEYADFTQKRIELARGLIAFLKKEDRPFLLVGDFNMPANGYIWDLYGDEFTDAFGATGRGYGFTFPSTTKNPLSFFGPWLRLDYLFAGKGWRPISSRVESRQPGQHRGVMAEFELQKQK